jgi:hypothetical protein
MNGGIGDLIDAQLGGANWANNRVGVCSAFLRYFVYFFRMTK